MSGRKNVLLPYKLVDAVSMATGFVSKPVNAQFQDNIGLQVAWTSSDAIGVIEVEASNDCKVDGAGNYLSGTFYALTFNPGLTQPDSNNGGYLVNINNFPFVYYRIRYTRTSGSGTLNVTTTSKEV